MDNKKFTSQVIDAFSAKRFEPEPRNHDGYGYKGHRFPIKGGISFYEVMARNVTRENALFKRLKAK